MYADEVGHRDWYEPHIGNVELAVLHPSSSIVKQVYMASKEGVIGAVSSLKDRSNLRWRHVFSPSDPITCIIPINDDNVFASTRSGQLFEMVPLTGQIKRITPLSSKIFDVNLQVWSCYSGITGDSKKINKKNGTIFLAVTTDKEGRKMRQVIMKSHDHFDFAGLTSFNFPIKSISASKCIKDSKDKKFWVLHNNGDVSIVNLNGEVNKTIFAIGVKRIIDINADNEAIIINFDNKYAIVAENDAPNSILYPCPSAKFRCSYSFADNLDSVLMMAQSKEGELRFKSNNLDFSVSNRDILFNDNNLIIFSSMFEMKTGVKLTVLIKHSNADITLITSSNKSGTYTGNIVWKRFEGVSSPAFVRIVDPDTVLPGSHLTVANRRSNKFGFDYTCYILSTYGTLYKFQTESNHDVHTSFFADVLYEVVKVLGDKYNSNEKIIYKRLSVESGRLFVTSVHKNDSIIVELSAFNGTFVSSYLVKDYKMSLAHLIIDNNDKISFHPKESSLPSVGTFAVDSNEIFKGKLRGLYIKADGMTTTTWINNNICGSNAKVVAFATVENRLQTLKTENLRAFPNATTKTFEIRKKYPTANIIVVAYIENKVTMRGEFYTLVVTAIDIVSGSTLAVTRHHDATGPIYMLIVDHTVLYHFYSTEHKRYLIGVWELFEDTDEIISDNAYFTIGQVLGSLFLPQRSQTVSSFTLRPPVLACQILQFSQGKISAMGVTTSFNGIAKKTIIFATTAGRIYSIDLRALLFKMPPEVKNLNEMPQLSLVFIPSHEILSHEYKVFQSAQVTTAPTQLESSCHVLISGLDIFYIRVNGGKAFDMLNDDYDHKLVFLICGCFILVTVIARYFAMKKNLKLQWR